MKRSIHLTYAVILSLGFVGVAHAENALAKVKPTVTSEFGKVVIIEAEFITKPADYYAEMIVNEPYYLKVLSVNGKALKEPVEIEYKLYGMDKVKKGMKYRFRAYEDVYSQGMPHGWRDDLQLEQIPYWIHNEMIIKPAANSTSESKQR